MKPEAREPKPPGHRLWIPVAIWTLAIGGVVAFRAQPEVEANFKSWATAAIILLGVALTVLWFLFLSRFRWMTRLGGVAIAVLLVVGLKQIVRVDGTANGTGLPNLAWKWSQHPADTQMPFARKSTVKPENSSPTSDIPDVPQFFGTDRTGVVRSGQLATNWTSVPPRELWRQPIGEGWSTFSVAGGRAFTQEQRGENELVTCYEALTGDLVWAHTNQARFFEWQGGPGPRATPTVDRGLVFTMGGTGILDCLEASTGKRRWSRSVLAENNLPNIIWGISCSPLVLGDRIIVNGGGTNSGTVLAYHRLTGDLLWKVGTDKSAYSSPAFSKLVGKPVILSANASSFTIHEPTTGAILLDYPWANDKWPKAAQPVVVGTNRVFLSAGYGVGCVMLELTNAVGGKFGAREVWKTKTMKTQFNSAALLNGHLYGLDDGLMACIEVETGKRVWKDGRYGSGQSLLVDNLVVVQAERGFVALVGATPTGFEELGRIPALGNKTWNHPVVAGRHLLVRNDREAVCYELPIIAADHASPIR